MTTVTAKPQTAGSVSTSMKIDIDFTENNFNSQAVLDSLRPLFLELKCNT